MKKNPSIDEYAFENYFFPKGDWVKNLRAIIHDTLQYHVDLNDRLKTQIVACFHSVENSSDRLVVTLINFLIGLSLILGMIALWVGFGLVICLVSLAFATVFCAIFLVNIAVSLLLQAVISIYLKITNFFILCRHCVRKVDSPIYLCPKCGAEHRLIPSLHYGILYWKCGCGKRLWTFRFLRLGKYEAKCSFKDCGHPLHWHDENITPKVIAITGGTYAGKSLFVQMMTNYLFSEKTNNGYRAIDSGNDKFWVQKLIANATEGTFPEKSNVSLFTKPHCFEKKHTPLRYYIFDQPGEVIEKMDKQLKERYLQWVNTIVFVVDPFALNSVRNVYSNYQGYEDFMPKGHSDVNPNDCVNVLEMIRNIIPSDNASKTQCAVVITKIDVPRFSEQFGIDSNSSSEQCEDFLRTHGGTQVVATVKRLFPKRNKFFAMTLTGYHHSSGAFIPEGLESCLKWTFGA